MSVMVKRFFIFGMLFGIFFASCSYNSGSNLTTSCSIEVDKDFVSGMRSVLQKSYSDTTQVRVNIECTGGYETSKWYDATIGTLPGVVFSFEEVPFDKTFSIYVGVYKGSELIYEASQKDIVITRTNPSFELSVLLKKLLNTDYVLYNKGEDYIQFYKTEKPAVSVAGNGDFASDTKDYCFDEDGYFYYIKCNDSGADFARPVICSDNPDFPADGIDLSPVLLSDSQPSSEAYVFSIDRATKTFYIYPLTFGDEPKIYKFPKLITSREITDSVCFGLNCSGVYPDNRLSKMVVNNGIMFVTAYKENDLMPVLLKIDVSSVQNEGTADAEVVANLSSVLKMNNYNVVINDMLYQDGSVYILVSDMVDHPQSSQDDDGPTMTTKLYSRGLLLNYDTSSGNVSSLGFSEEVKKNTDMGTSGLYTYMSDSQLFVDNAYTKAFVLPSIIAYTDSAGNEQKLDISQYFPSIYSPAPLATSLSTTCFYGAEKFIAIKPKKLVIADDGFAFYTASDGGIKLKNVNRVITVDLEKFAISSINNANAAFASEVESFSMGAFSSTTEYQSGMKSLTDNNDGTVYYDLDNEAKTINVAGYTISLAIPCGD